MAYQQSFQVCSLLSSCRIVIHGLASLSTIHREYAALMALPYYQFFDTVLRPRLNNAAVADVTELRRIMTEYQVNEPQAIAISTALRTEGFTLIQGLSSFLPSGSRLLTYRHFQASWYRQNFDYMRTCGCLLVEPSTTCHPCPCWTKLYNI
jgi:hypothetical protein